MRLLDARGIGYEVRHYDPGLRDARDVAAAVGFPPGEVFKTLVARLAGIKNPLLVMLPANTTLNLKRLAAELGVKKAAMLPHAEAEKLTGLQVGGISALALTQKRWHVVLDARGAWLSHTCHQRGTARHAAAHRDKQTDCAAGLPSPGCRRRLEQRQASQVTHFGEDAETSRLLGRATGSPVPC